MSRIPSLGPRGEGWVALQLGALAVVALAGQFDTGTRAIDPGLGAMVAAGGALLLTTSVVLIVSGAFLLRNATAFSILPEPVAGGQLVESGPYRIVRHPVYAGLIVGGLGFALQRLSLPTLLATALLFVVLDLKRRREEARLMERFSGYGAYRERTKAFVPFVY